MTKTEIREELTQVNKDIDSLESKISSSRNQKDREALQSQVNDLQARKEFLEECL